MKLFYIAAIFLVFEVFIYAQTPSPKNTPAPDAQTIEEPDKASTHGKEATALHRPHKVPRGHTEKTLTIKPVSGSIPTKECGAVTELTVLHRSHEPGMMAHVLGAIKTGQILLLEDAKCLGKGRAVASAVRFEAVAQPELAQAERCKFPLPTGSQPGC